MVFKGLARIFFVSVRSTVSVSVVLADISTHYEKGKILLRLLGGLIALSGLYFLVSAL